MEASGAVRCGSTLVLLAVAAVVFNGRPASAAPTPANAPAAAQQQPVKSKQWQPQTIHHPDIIFFISLNLTFSLMSQQVPMKHNNYNNNNKKNERRRPTRR